MAGLVSFARLDLDLSLTFGRNGFNGGDPYTASPDAGAAVLNTNLCTAVSMLTWMLLDVAFFKKPSVIGAVQGIITGLVAITPAAGYVAGWGAIIIGICSGSIPWVSMNTLGKAKWFLESVDDVVGDFHTHLVGGIVGGFLTGLFATSEGTAAFAIAPTGGAIDGNGRQVWVQIVGFLFIIGWNVFWTSAICLFIKYVLRVPLRYSEEQLLVGDQEVHGELPYAFFHEGKHDYDAQWRRPSYHSQVHDGVDPETGGVRSPPEAPSSDDGNKSMKQA